jgi:trehalose 6-phosphate synthase
MVTTPLREGMNLVAKEYVAAHNDERGALELSEFAGAAAELESAFLVNPHDVEDLKRALIDALRADDVELTERMRPMRAQVRENDIEKWARDFLGVLGVPV